MSLVFCHLAGSWLPYSPLFPVFRLSLYFRIWQFFLKLVQHTQSFPSPWYFSYHLLQKAFASGYMTDPIVFLLQITSIRLLSFCTIISTSSFVFMSLQLIFSIFLHTHISKASSLRISSFLYVNVSAA